jgi:hypothetical protein
MSNVHEIQHAVVTTSKLENSFWQYEAASPFKSFQRQIIGAMKEVMDVRQTLYPSQMVLLLLKNIRSFNITKEFKWKFQRKVFYLNFKKYAWDFQEQS